MNKQEILAMASKDPRFQQGADILESQLSQMQVTPEMLQELVTTLEYVMSNPAEYPKVRQMAIQKGFAQEQDIPPDFKPEFVLALLLALYAMQDRLEKGSMAFARGGLARYGRGGDTMLAHINPMEAEVLRRMGGSGTVNPNTGIREFKGGGLGKILSAVVPIALTYFTGGTAGIFMHMAAGAATSALTGGNIAQGALFGGLGAGLGNTVGNAAKGMMGDFGASLGQGATGALGNALVGGVAGAASGQGFGQGAVRGALGSALGSATSGMGSGMATAGQTAGNLFTTGASAQDAILGGGLAGLAQGMANKYQRPSDVVSSPVGGKGLSASGSSEPGLHADTAPGLSEMGGGQGVQGGLSALASAPPSMAPAPGFSLNTGQMLALAPAALSLLGSAQTPEQVQQAASAMSPEQKAFFEKSAPAWDWGKIQREASAAGKGLGAYVAENWNKFTPGNQFEQPTATKKLARGGLGMLASGGGSGRDDTIDARLSDGEYVFDAETTALLGDGSVKEGAKRLDAMREQIRKHKGSALSRGKISPNAKSPLNYLKEVA